MGGGLYMFNVLITFCWFDYCNGRHVDLCRERRSDTGNKKGCTQIVGGACLIIHVSRSKHLDENLQTHKGPTKNVENFVTNIVQKNFDAKVALF